jgi:hypothetical protein
MPLTSPTSVTFAVDDVTPAGEPLPTCKPLEAIQALLDAPPGRYAADESAQGQPTRGRVEACWSYSLDCVAAVPFHPLVAAAHLAFSGHRPLVLSPDVIWVTIAQGLAQHLRLDPERYRSFLVRHEGRKKITLKRDDLHRRSPENPWAEVVGSFASVLKQEVGPLAEALVCDFSTTGPVERTVSEVVLLDALQPYFSYNRVCICGIPAVTLEGSAADWRRLREKVELLAPFELDWWLREVRPICDHFVRAAAGDVDRLHWQRLYKIRQVYGAEVINGWLGKLFPYLKDFRTGACSCRNDLLDPKVQAEIRKVEHEEARGRAPQVRFHAPGIRAEDLPRGLSQVPFVYRDERGRRAMELLAGPAVVTQDEETLALRPLLGWAVREAPAIEQALTRLAEHLLVPASVDDFEERLRGVGGGYLPTDAVRFYQLADGAEIHGGLYRVLPLAEWCEPEWSRQTAGELYRFACLADGTELVIRLYDRDNKAVGSVFVGRRLAGAAPPDAGLRVARSFTDFLLRAFDGPEVPYFRRADFIAPGD